MSQTGLIKRTVIALVAMVVAVAWAGATTAAAQTEVVDEDFSGGTHDGTEVVADGLELRLDIDFIEDFDGTALPTGWEMFNTAPWTGGTATVADEALTVTGARANTTAFYDSGRSLDFGATFTADTFQHVGFGNTFEDAPWAMFSTGGGSLPVGLYARTSAPGGTAENTPIADINPLEEHDYSIEWTPTEVVYSVDGEEVATHDIAITAQMRPIASDLNAAGGSLVVDYLDLYPLGYPSEGTFTSRVFDAGVDDATWLTLTADADAPEDTGVSFEVRTGDTATPDASWTDWQPVPAGGALPGPEGQRYLQYRATLTTDNRDISPFVYSVTLENDVDTTAPTVTIGDVTVIGTTAQVTFSSEAGATFACSLDNGAFATCTSPEVYTGLTIGSHTIRVRATDQAGNIGLAEQAFEVVGTAPAVTIGDVVVTGATARVSFSSEAGATFACSLDNGAFETCTSPAVYTGLSHGSHTIRVRATNQAGTGPVVERTFHVDTVAPAVTIADVAVAGTTARVSFSSEAGARFECSLDNGAFQTCTSPLDYTGLAVGSHTVRVRAIDQVGNVGAAAERVFAIASPPPPPDTTAPKVRPKPKTVFVTNKGRFKLRLRCPSSETRCRIALRIRYRGNTVSSKAVTVLGGRTATVTLRLKPSARLALNSNGRLRVTAVTTARDAAGNRATTQTRLRLRD